jgi:hypothetical protein
MMIPDVLIRWNYTVDFVTISRAVVDGSRRPQGGVIMMRVLAVIVILLLVLIGGSFIVRTMSHHEPVKPPPVSALDSPKIGDIQRIKKLTVLSGHLFDIQLESGRRYLVKKC